MNNIKLLTILFITTALLTACPPPATEVESDAAAGATDIVETDIEAIEELPTAGTTIEEQGECNLGKKSGGVTLTTEQECTDLGGNFLN